MWQLIAWSVPLLVLVLVLLVPWTVARGIFIPLGMPRAARWLASLAAGRWEQDGHGGGLIAAAWAVLRQATPDPDAIVWIERARDAQPMLRASHVLATGLLAAARGDLDCARLLLDSVTGLGPRTTPRLVRALAREWLVADAARRGKWAWAAHMTRGPRLRSRTLRLLDAASARLAGWADAPPVPWLWLMWLMAPRRRHTLALVRRAAAPIPAPGSAGGSASGGADDAPASARPALHPDAYQHALRAHVAVLGNLTGAGRTADAEAAAHTIEDLARAWDQALDAPETRRMVMERAAALGVRNGEAALQALADAVTRDLATLIRAALLPLPPRAMTSRTMREAARLLREELISEIELAFDALQNRVLAERRLTPIDEWREWLALRALHQRAAAVGGIELRRMVFAHVHQVGCKYAVWLWNQRTQHLMANEMFRWLLGEAVIVGDSEAAELQRRNWEDRF